MRSFLIISGMIFLLVISSFSSVSSDNNAYKNKTDVLEGVNLNMYKEGGGEFLVLTINMHTYQETDQEEKFDLIVNTIANLDIDFVLMQETAQHMNSPIAYGDIKQDNMAYVIQKKLLSSYNLTYYFKWDWSHYGWNVWEEGIAILAKDDITHVKSEYVSSYTSTSNIQSRKILFGQVNTTNYGLLNLVSAHLSWRLSETSEEQNNQIKNTRILVNNQKSLFGGFSIVGGDFNGKPTDTSPWDEGYLTMINNGEYNDSFLIANPDANNLPQNSSYDTVKGSFPGRIDYIFHKSIENSNYSVLGSQIIFTPDVIGSVSDHYGVLTKYSHLNYVVNTPEETSESISTNVGDELPTGTTINTETSEARSSLIKTLFVGTLLITALRHRTRKKKC